MDCHQCGGALAPGMKSCYRCGAVRPAVDAESESAGVHRLPPLGVAAVDAALDWVWLFDTGQGDFNAARTAAERALDVRRDASTLLARAVVHQLQAEFDAALALLEEAFAAAPDEGRRYVIAALAHVVERRRLDVLPDGDSADFTEAAARWGTRDAETEWVRRARETYLRVKEPHALLAGDYLYYLVSMTATWRNVVWTAASDARAERYNELTETLSGWVTRAREAGEGRLFRALVGLHAELMAAAGYTAEATNMLELLARVHGASADATGAAWCALARGDVLASPPPLGRPVLFGYVVKEQPTSTTGLADASLFDRSGIDVAGARAAYEEARRLYEAAGAKRGVAASVLRLAYLDAADGERGWAHAARGYDEARSIFEEAGDRTGAWLARAGQLWARLGAGEAGLAPAARSLAEEMKAAGALTRGLCTGLAFARAGREALAARGDVDAAARAARLAELFFEVFDAPLKRGQACNDRAEAFNTLDMTEAAVTEWDAALGWMQQAVRRHSDDHGVKLVAMQSAYNLVNLYAYGLDAAGLERALTRAQAFADGVPHVSEEELARLKRDAFDSPAPAQDDAFAPDDPTRRLPAIRKFFESFRPYMIHAVLRLIEEQVSVYEPMARGTRKLAGARGEEAAPFFEEALGAADRQVERDFYRAMIFSSWRKADETREAVARFIGAGMPQSNHTMTDIQLAVAPDIDPALAGQTRRWIESSLRRTLGSMLMTVGAWDEARAQYEEAEPLAGGPPTLSRPVPTPDEISLLANYALVADGLGEGERALAHMSEAVEGLEARRRYLRQENVRRAFGGQRTTLGMYADYARLLAARGRWEESFAVADMTRARVLAESLGGARAATEQLMTAGAYRRYTEQAAAVERLTTQLAAAQSAGDPDYLSALAQQLDSAAAELDAREEALGRAAPQWRELSAPRADVLSVAEVAERLPAGTLLLAYIYFDKYLLSWALTRAGLVSQQLVGEFDGRPFQSRPFAVRARAWTREVSRREEEEEGLTLDASFGETLAGTLLGAHADDIEAAEHLLIVPFAELNTFPFQALPWRGGALGLQKSVSYLPAASVLRYFRDSDPRAAGALVVGDPAAMSYADAATGRVEALDPLPAARLEAETVAALYNTQPLVGARATEPAVREALARAPRLIHFATHGFLQEGAPLASGVALASGEAITADELMGLDLKADVVVLSACDTGRGRLQGSELVGLARGLLYAGARAAVVSLWPVDDVATAMLMEFFHAESCAATPPALALRRAQQRLQRTDAAEAADYYARAADAYAEAVAALEAAGHAEAAERFREKLGEVELRAELGALSPAGRPFEDACHWAAFQVIGDWR
jgi:CHAT domain-containing protein